MSRPTDRIQTIMLVVVAFAAWFALLHEYPVETIPGFMAGELLLATILFQSHDWRRFGFSDRLRSKLWRVLGWIGASGLTAIAVYGVLWWIMLFLP
jgi:hypothetical protein